MDQRERAAGEHAGRQREPRVVPRVAGEERAHRTEQHHALDPEVQDARAFGQDLAERGQGERHPEADRARERDDPHVAVEAAVGEDRRDRMHHAGAASGAGSATGVGPDHLGVHAADDEPVGAEDLATERDEQDRTFEHVRDRDRHAQVAGCALQVGGTGTQAAEEHRHQHDTERVVARERGDDDPGVAEVEHESVRVERVGPARRLRPRPRCRRAHPRPTARSGSCAPSGCRRSGPRSASRR